jgi:ubiquinone/menaquinone biosynthesis C-methylase UbiE
MNEESKYESAWKTGLEQNSRTALPFAEFIAKMNYKGSMLDLGCGNGLVVSCLHSKGCDIRGVDITLAGLDMEYRHYGNGILPGPPPSRELFVKAPLWDLPFEDGEFDFTFSCDVLEHIPPDKVGEVLKEICRVSKQRTYHIIATFKHLDLHPTVQPISWWLQQFGRANKKKCQVECVSRRDFLFRHTGYLEVGL